MKLNLEKIKSLGNFRNLLELLEKNSGRIVFVFFLAVVGYSVYLWYFLIQNPGWNEAKKNEYIKTKDKGVILNEKKLEEAVLESQTRRDNYAKNIDNTKDIFQLKK